MNAKIDRVTKWKISLWTPGNMPAFDGATFGCASHGLAAPGVWSDPQAPSLVSAPRPFSGEVVAGSYADVLEQLRHISFIPQAAIILFSGGTGAEKFLQEWQKLFPAVPVTGGAAARGNGQERGELLPPAEDVGVLLLTEGSWQAETLKVHDVVGTAWQFRADGPRTITHLRRSASNSWETAAAAFRAAQTKLGRENTDCESITWSDVNGRNLHCSFAGEFLQSGADLPPDGQLLLRTISRAEAAKKLGQFCAQPNALVFGCAGLRSLLDAPFATGSDCLAGFLFGELVTLAGQPQFGNLMASRLVCQ
jgi:hypothetical protein